jgi:signal transduction histidine kinase
MTQRTYGCRGGASSAAWTIFRSAVRLMTMRLEVSSVRSVKIDWQKLDYVVAAGTTVGLGLEAWTNPAAADHHQILVPLICLPATLGVAIRRRSPALAALAAIVSSNVGQTFWSNQLTGDAVAWMCDMYALAVWTRWRTFSVLMAVYILGDIALWPLGGGSVSNAGFFILVSSIVIVLVRLGIQSRDRRADLAEREREVAAREAVVEERARIARELHDAIAHNVSMMVVQAGAERRVLDESQESTRDVLETVEQIGRNALTEMRRLVGMLRTDDDDPLAPQPGLRDLPRLVGQVRDAGLPVELQVEGEPRELPLGLELSAYRIVQEALTNALKHAGDARATVRVHYTDDSLELEVVDDGVGAAAAVASGGHGLVGMRERVALYGGRFEAGRRPAGGFTVRVLLPIG